MALIIMNVDTESTKETEQIMDNVADYIADEWPGQLKLLKEVTTCEKCGHWDRGTQKGNKAICKLRGTFTDNNYYCGDNENCNC